jgi:nitroimidazol reductase NimA-like FMN-containing flavoprotein (pyridoxamine 5'-phosphate oxidase superfamily)
MTQVSRTADGVPKKGNMKTNRSKVRRRADRGHYDRETVYAILDKEFICQIGFVHDNHPVVIPTIYGREGNSLVFHGANVSRMLQTLEKGVPVSLNVTRTNGLVLARSAFHHSLNYESVTLFGTARLVSEPERKMRALKVITDQILKHRWNEVRLPNEKELNATKILEFEITEGSAKIRNEGVSDDNSDYELDVWAGVVPIDRTYGEALPDGKLKAGIDTPPSVKRIEGERF